MNQTCDQCRSPVPEGTGQTTADTVLCDGCLKKAGPRPGETFETVRGALDEDDPTVYERHRV